MDIWLPTDLGKIKNSGCSAPPGVERNGHMGSLGELSTSSLVKSSPYGFSCQDQHFTVVIVCFPDSISFHSLLSHYHPATLVFVYVFKHAWFSLHLCLDIGYSPYSNLAILYPAHQSDFHLQVTSIRRQYPKGDLYYISIILFICMFMCLFIQHRNLFAALTTVCGRAPFCYVL